MGKLTISISMAMFKFANCYLFTGGHEPIILKCVVQCLALYWVKYNDLAVLRNPGIMVHCREIIPFMVKQFRLVKYDNLPRNLSNKKPNNYLEFPNIPIYPLVVSHSCGRSPFLMGKA